MHRKTLLATSMVRVVCHFHLKKKKRKQKGAGDGEVISPTQERSICSIHTARVCFDHHVRHKPKSKFVFNNWYSFRSHLNYLSVKREAVSSREHDYHHIPTPDGRCTLFTKKRCASHFTREERKGCAILRASCGLWNKVAPD